MSAGDTVESGGASGRGEFPAGIALVVTGRQRLRIERKGGGAGGGERCRQQEVFHIFGAGHDTSPRNEAGGCLRPLCLLVARPAKRFAPIDFSVMAVTQPGTLPLEACDCGLFRILELAYPAL
jgi:hypothetical protein